MLPLLGPQPVTALQRPDEASLAFRLNQRLTAQVLQIATDHVALALEGVRVVARLTSPEQAAMLAERRTAQFIVRGLSDNVLTLQVADVQSGESAAPLASPPNPISELLKQVGLPVNEANELIARALIDHGLPVTPELAAELGQALAGLKQSPEGDLRWGQAEAQTAAALKAAGLPLSPESLALAGSHPAPLAESLLSLRAQLSSLSTTPLPARLSELVQNALRVLDQLNVDWGAPAPVIAAQLREAVATLGRSLERDLAALPSGDALLTAQKGLLALAQLRGEIAAHLTPETKPLLGALDRFLDATRLTHFNNIAPERPLAPAGGHWLTMTLPLSHPTPGPDHAAAHLRVAYRAEGGAEAIDPAHTRLVLQVDLDEGQTLEVDLSVVERQIGAWVTASDGDLRDAAEAELPGLEAGLQKLGFALKTARCAVGRPTLAPNSTLVPVTVTPDRARIRVNVEA
jgi:hypothetical protein